MGLETCIILIANTDTIGKKAISMIQVGIEWERSNLSFLIFTRN